MAFLVILRFFQLAIRLVDICTYSSVLRLFSIRFLTYQFKELNYIQWILTIICYKSAINSSLLPVPSILSILLPGAWNCSLPRLLAGISLGQSIALSDEPRLSGTDVIEPVGRVSHSHPIVGAQMPLLGYKLV